MQVVKEAADKPREITYKGATDLVTDTDQRSEKEVLGVRLLRGLACSCAVQCRPSDQQAAVHASSSRKSTQTMAYSERRVASWVRALHWLGLMLEGAVGGQTFSARAVDACSLCCPLLAACASIRLGSMALTRCGCAGNVKSDYLWICDPIDGTTNFTHSCAPVTSMCAVLPLIVGTYQVRPSAICTQAACLNANLVALWGDTGKQNID